MKFNKHKSILTTFLFCFFALSLFVIPQPVIAKGICACYSLNGDCKATLETGGSASESGCKSLCQTKLEKNYSGEIFGPGSLAQSTIANCDIKHAEFLKKGPATPEEAAEAKETIKPLISPKLNVEIPGFSFSKAVFSKGGESGLIQPAGVSTVTEDYVETTFIADYVTAMYRYLISISTIIAIIMIMIGGLQYVLAAGSGDVGKAKTRIKNAIIGLVLLLSVYTILYLVNPQLTLLKPIRLNNITAVHVGGANAAETKSSCKGKKQPSQNFGIGTFDPSLEENSCGNRPLSSIKYVVIHEGGGGAAQTTINILKNRGLSTHFVIGPSGETIQTVGVERTAYHAGGGINKHSIGIDLSIPKDCRQSNACVQQLACSSKCFYTDAQYSALKTLLNSIASKTSASFDDEHVIGHCQVPGHADPRGLDWNRLGLTQSKHRLGDSIFTGKCVPSNWKTQLKSTNTSTKAQYCCTTKPGGSEKKTTTDSIDSCKKLGGLATKGACPKTKSSVTYCCTIPDGFGTKKQPVNNVFDCTALGGKAKEGQC